jgi:hypothetical protein
VYFPVQYADDFVILLSGTREDAEAEKAALAEYLERKTGLDLSPEKTRVTDLREGFEFLGHRVRLKWHHQFGLMPRIEIPKHKQADLRYRVKQETRRDSLPALLLTVSRGSIDFCAAGATIIASAPVPAPFSITSTIMLGIDCGAGSLRSIRACGANVRVSGDCGALLGRRV